MLYFGIDQHAGQRRDLVHVLASTPGLESGALFVGKMDSLRSPDNRSQWSSGLVPEAARDLDVTSGA
jgi:hypothetical protein